MVLGGLAVALVGLGGLLVSGGVGPVLGSTVVMAVGLTSLLPVVQAYLMDHFPDDSVGGDYGAAKTLFTGIGSLGPTATGLLVTHVGYLAAFSSLGPVLLLAVAVLVTGERSG